MSDYNNLSKFDTKNLPVSIFAPEKKDTSNCVVVSLLEIPDGYKKIVYLDEPFFIHNVDVEKSIYVNAPKNGIVDTLATGRDVFSAVYSDLNGISGQKFINICSLYERNKNRISVDKNQFVFVLSVFFELGIFYIANDVIKKNDKIKSALTNSEIYCRICFFKGEIK